MPLTPRKPTCSGPTSQRSTTCSIPGVLNAGQAREIGHELHQAEWVDGRITAGHQSERVKNNRQIPQSHPVARRLGDAILTSLEQNPLFLSAALPRKIVPLIAQKLRAATLAHS